MGIIVTLITVALWLIPVPLCSLIDRVGIKRGLWGSYTDPREFKLSFWWMPVINIIILITEVVLVLDDVTRIRFPKFFHRFYNKDITK